MTPESCSHPKGMLRVTMDWYSVNQVQCDVCRHILAYDLPAVLNLILSLAATGKP